MKQVFIVILIVKKTRLFSNLLFKFCPADPRAEFVIDYDTSFLHNRLAGKYWFFFRNQLSS